MFGSHRRFSTGAPQLAAFVLAVLSLSACGGGSSSDPSLEPPETGANDDGPTEERPTEPTDLGIDPPSGQQPGELGLDDDEEAGPEEPDDSSSNPDSVAGSIRFRDVGLSASSPQFDSMGNIAFDGRTFGADDQGLWTGSLDAGVSLVVEQGTSHRSSKA